MFQAEESPFDKFVSRGDLLDEIDIPGPHEAIDDAVEQALEDIFDTRVPKVISILGDNGEGKTHLFWALEKKFLSQAYFIFVPAPMSTKNVLIHLYTCFVEGLGEDRLHEIIAKLAGNWGANTKIYGIFRTTDVEGVIQRAISLETMGTGPNPALEDCIKAIIRHEMDLEKRDLAERWILGELMDYPELQQLDIDNNLKEGDRIFAMMKLVMEAMDEVVVLFFDELEKPFHADDLILEVAEGVERPQQIFDVIYRLLHETTNLLSILSTNAPDWPNVQGHIPPPLLEILGPNLSLRPFTFPEFQELYQEIFRRFWQEKQIGLIQDPLWPLTTPVLERIFARGQLNPRECLRLLKKLFSALAFEEWDEKELKEKILEDI
ncbi:MAG TPA: hypothetical protein VKK79_13285 [Candidatus Lokiarchaeia archaeon]|nr:hypothetical protein [Candidatus Lokiarchaeia archaeon]